MCNGYDSELAMAHESCDTISKKGTKNSRILICRKILQEKVKNGCDLSPLNLAN